MTSRTGSADTVGQVDQQLIDDRIDTVCRTLQQRLRSVPNPRRNRLEGGHHR